MTCPFPARLLGLRALPFNDKDYLDGLNREALPLLRQIRELLARLPTWCAVPNEQAVQSGATIDGPLAPFLALTPFTVATQPAAPTGSLGYCSNGASGSPCLAIRIGGVWYQLTEGAAVTT